MPAPSNAKVEQLHGIVKTLTFVNPENGYFVARVTTGKGERTVVGNAPVIHVGEHITAQGTWHSSNWGPQFKAQDVILSAPKMLDGIEKYLSSAVPGIGKGYAKKLVQAFGEDVFDVIEREPTKLNDLKGIGPKRATSIIEAYNEQKEIREIMVFLHRSGLSAMRAKKVHEKYGAQAVERIKENPYILCRDIWGIGFSIADTVAQKQGIAADSEYRLRAGVQHVLREAELQGSCGLPVEVVREKASELLGMDYDLINRAIEFELEAQTLVKDTSGEHECLFSKRIYDNEKAIAMRLLKHTRRVPARTIHNLEQKLTDAQVEIGIELEEAQKDAVRAALSNQLCVLTGGPGTGKTTITRVLLRIFQESGLTSIALAAPTGKAARRASEATGQTALTIHRLMEYKGDGFKYDEKNPLQCDVLILDEMSMVDVNLMNAITKALSPSTRFIIIGDVDQLPSVGSGKILADIISSGALPTVRLSAIFRQAAASKIITNAHAINRGDMPDLGWKEGSDFCFTNISPKNPKDDDEKKECRERIEAEVLRLCRDMYKLGYDPIREVQVLAPMRRGVLGVEALNTKLQAILNPRPEAVLEFFGTKWGTGDKVMQLRNNYEKNVFNGDIGYIVAVDKEERVLAIDFDGTVVTYKAAELEEITLAYAFTIHKSQGSEFPVVIMPLDWSHFTMLKRNLLYTGVTRARKLCVIVGQPGAAQVAVRTAQNEERYTRLKEWLRQGLPPEMRDGPVDDGLDFSQLEAA